MSVYMDPIRYFVCCGTLSVVSPKQLQGCSELHCYTGFCRYWVDRDEKLPTTLTAGTFVHPQDCDHDHLLGIPTELLKNNNTFIIRMHKSVSCAITKKKN